MSVDTMSIEDALTVVAVATPGSVAWKAARSVLALYERVGLNRAAWLGTREEMNELLDAMRAERKAAVHLLGQAARGELPRCGTCGDNLATRLWEQSGDVQCDECFREGESEARDDGEGFDASGCVDLPNAEALRAAMRVIGTEEGR